MESRGTVIDLIRKKGDLLAAFNTHDGIFRVVPGNEAMLRTLEESRDRKTEVVFEFGPDLSLVSVAPAPSRGIKAKP